MPLFEVALPGYDANEPATSHLVVWVTAPDIQAVHACNTVGLPELVVCPLNLILPADHEEIEYRLPEDAERLAAKLADYSIRVDNCEYLIIRLRNRPYVLTVWKEVKDALAQCKDATVLIPVGEQDTIEDALNPLWW